jgi:hypothetical protein
MSVRRAGAFTAVIGGVIRAAASFAPAVVTSTGARESLFLAVDVCMAVSLVSFWWIQELSPAGVVGLTLALAGITGVRLDRALSTGNLYPLAALATAVGIIALSGSLWSRRMISGWVPLAFALSMLLGIAGTAVKGADALFVLSGVVFGATFAVLGYSLQSSLNTDAVHVTASREVEIRSE